MVAEFQSLGSAGVTQLQTSMALDFDFGAHVHIDSLPVLSHESQNPFQPGISSFADGTFAHNTLPQYCFNFNDVGDYQTLLSSSLSSLGSGDSLGLDQQPSSDCSSPASLETWTTQSPQSLTSHTTDNVPEGKREIDPVWTTFVCDTCKATFTSEARYTKHKRQSNCTAPSPNFACNACSRPFSCAKNLKRHQESACATLKTGSRPTCTCNNRYGRKDVLQRHMTAANTRSHNQQHKCTVCQKSRCCC